MGKKSKRNRNTAASAPLPAAASVASSPNMEEDATTTDVNSSGPVYYPSDGPSDAELLQTTSSSLQAKLNQLTDLGLAGNKAGFVQNFVPVDLSSQDAQGYLEDLTTAPEAEGQWTNLIAEIAAIRSGKGVDRIEGDQVTRASFFFTHPLLEKCDREVTFVCVGGEWRADG